jgi:hypothetical protein
MRNPVPVPGVPAPGVDDRSLTTGPQAVNIRPGRIEAAATEFRGGAATDACSRDASGDPGLGSGPWAALPGAGPGASCRSRRL